MADKGKLRVIVPDKEFAGLPRSGNVLSFEADMAEKLADHLGVEPMYVYAERYDSILPWLTAGKGDVAIASLTATGKRRTVVDFSAPVGHVREMLVGRAGDTAQLRTPGDLDGEVVTVRRSSSYYATLHSLTDSLPGLRIEAAPEHLHTHEILHNVAAGTYPLTVCDSDIAEAVLSYEPRLAVLFPLTGYRPICWATAKDCDSLLRRLDTFIFEQALTAHRRQRFTGDLPGIRKRRCLRVATRNNAATYWIYRGREVGFEYELCRAFAKKHGLRLEMVIAPDRTHLLQYVVEGKADVAAACLTVTPGRKERAAFGAPYLFPREVVVCRVDSAGKPLIASEEELVDRTIHVRRSSSYYGTLDRLTKRLGSRLDIEPVPEDVETEEILQRVASGRYDVTVADDYLVESATLHNADIAAAFPISEPRRIGWAIRPDAVKLKAAIDAFFTSGPYEPKALHYNILHRRYFESKRQARRAVSAGRADLEGRISEYDALMKKYAERRGLDWRMLTAQVFQESRFDPHARSWAGAVGLMQIMPGTAAEMGIDNPGDPEHNVRAGTTYMTRLLDRFEKSIPYRQRYHLALASYNAGYGHVADARRLARRRGLDANRWFGSVEQAMLLLSRPQFHRQSRYGYVRGQEPVTYVATIQRLYNHYSQIDLAGRGKRGLKPDRSLAISGLHSPMRAVLKPENGYPPSVTRPPRKVFCREEVPHENPPSYRGGPCRYRFSFGG